MRLAPCATRLFAFILRRQGGGNWGIFGWKLCKAQKLLQYHPIFLRRGGVYPRPKPGNLSERVGIKPTPTDGVHLEGYLHKLMRYV